MCVYACVYMWCAPITFNEGRQSIWRDAGRQGIFHCLLFSLWVQVCVRTLFFTTFYMCVDWTKFVCMSCTEQGKTETTVVRDEKLCVWEMRNCVCVCLCVWDRERESACVWGCCKVNTWCQKDRWVMSSISWLWSLNFFFFRSYLFQRTHWLRTHYCLQ